MPTTFADDDFGYEQWLGSPGRLRRELRAQSWGCIPRTPPLSCRTISGTLARGEIWTARGYLKACVDSIAELEAWSGAATGGRVRRCGICVP
jgi:hypothetical protein